MQALVFRHLPQADKFLRSPNRSYLPRGKAKRCAPRSLASRRQLFDKGELPPNSATGLKWKKLDHELYIL